MSKATDFNFDEDHGRACCDCRDSDAALNGYGYCGLCWVNLSAQQRAVLRGVEPPLKEIITHRVVETKYPPEPSRLWKLAKLLWAAAMTAAVAWLVWVGKGRG